MLVCTVSSIQWLIYKLFTLTLHSTGPQLRWLGFDSKHFFVFSKIQKYDDQTKMCENVWLSCKRKLKIKTNCLEEVSRYIFLQYYPCWHSILHCNNWSYALGYDYTLQLPLNEHLPYWTPWFGPCHYLVTFFDSL